MLQPIRIKGLHYFHAVFSKTLCLLVFVACTTAPSPSDQLNGLSHWLPSCNSSVMMIVQQYYRSSVFNAYILYILSPSAKSSWKVCNCR